MPVSSIDVANLLAGQQQNVMNSYAYAYNVGAQGNRFLGLENRALGAPQSQTGMGYAMAGAGGTEKLLGGMQMAGSGLAAAAAFGMAPRYFDPFSTTAQAAITGFKGGGVSGALGGGLLTAGAYLAIGKAANFMTSNIIQGAQQRAHVQNIVQGGAPMAQMGFQMDFNASQGITNSIMQMGDIGASMGMGGQLGSGNIANVVGMGMAGGQFRGVQSANEFRSRMRQLVGEAAQVASIMQTSIEEASQTISEMQGMGIGRAQVPGFISNIANNVRTTGLGAQQQIQMASFGAQTFRGMGLTGAQGINYGLSAGRNIAYRANVSGEFNRELLNDMGGAQAATQRFTEAAVNIFSGRRGQRLLGAMMDENGQLDTTMAFKIATGQATKTEIGKEYRSRTAGAQKDVFLANRTDIMGQFMEQYGPQGAMGGLGSMLEGHSKPQYMMQALSGLGRREVEELSQMGDVSSSLRLKMRQAAESGLRDSGMPKMTIGQIFSKMLDKVTDPIKKTFQKFGRDIQEGISNIVEDISRDISGQGYAMAPSSGNVERMIGISTARPDLFNNTLSGITNYTNQMMDPWMRGTGAHVGSGPGMAPPTTTIGGIARSFMPSGYGTFMQTGDLGDLGAPPILQGNNAFGATLRGVGGSQLLGEAAVARGQSLIDRGIGVSLRSTGGPSAAAQKLIQRGTSMSRVGGYFAEGGGIVGRAGSGLNAAGTALGDLMEPGALGRGARAFRDARAAGSGVSEALAAGRGAFSEGGGIGGMIRGMGGRGVVRGSLGAVGGGARALGYATKALGWLGRKALAPLALLDVYEAGKWGLERSGFMAGGSEFGEIAGAKAEGLAVASSLGLIKTRMVRQNQKLTEADEEFGITEGVDGEFGAREYSIKGYGKNTDAGFFDNYAHLGRTGDFKDVVQRGISEDELQKFMTTDYAGALTDDQRARAATVGRAMERGMDAFEFTKESQIESAIGNVNASARVATRDFNRFKKAMEVAKVSRKDLGVTDDMTEEEAEAQLGKAFLMSGRAGRARRAIQEGQGRDRNFAMYSQSQWDERQTEFGMEVLTRMNRDKFIKRGIGEYLAKEGRTDMQNAAIEGNRIGGNTIISRNILSAVGGVTGAFEGKRIREGAALYDVAPDGTKTFAGESEFSMLDIGEGDLPEDVALRAGGSSMLLAERGLGLASAAQGSGGGDTRGKGFWAKRVSEGKNKKWEEVGAEFGKIGKTEAQLAKYEKLAAKITEESIEKMGDLQPAVEAMRKIVKGMDPKRLMNAAIIDYRNPNKAEGARQLLATYQADIRQELGDVKGGSAMDEFLTGDNAQEVMRLLVGREFGRQIETESVEAVKRRADEAMAAAKFAGDKEKQNIGAIVAESEIPGADLIGNALQGFYDTQTAIANNNGLSAREKIRAISEANSELNEAVAGVFNSDGMTDETRGQLISHLEGIGAEGQLTSVLGAAARGKAITMGRGSLTGKWGKGKKGKFSAENKAARIVKMLEGMGVKDAAGLLKLRVGKRGLELDKSMKRAIEGGDFDLKAAGLEKALKGTFNALGLEGPDLAKGVIQDISALFATQSKEEWQNVATSADVTDTYQTFATALETGARNEAAQTGGQPGGASGKADEFAKKLGLANEQLDIFIGNIPKAGEKIKENQK